MTDEGKDQRINLVVAWCFRKKQKEQLTLKDDETNEIESHTTSVGKRKSILTSFPCSTLYSLAQSREKCKYFVICLICLVRYNVPPDRE